MSNSRKNSKSSNQGTTPAAASSSHWHHKNLRRHLDMGQSSYGGAAFGSGAGDSSGSGIGQSSNLFEIKKRSIDFFQQNQKSIGGGASGVGGHSAYSNSTVGGVGFDTDSQRRSSPNNAYASGKRGSSGGGIAASILNSAFGGGSSGDHHPIQNQSKVQQLFFKNNAGGEQQKPQQNLQSSIKGSGGFFLRNTSGSAQRQKNTVESQNSQPSTHNGGADGYAKKIPQSPQMSPKNIKDLLKKRPAIESIRNFKKPVGATTTNELAQSLKIQSSQAQANAIGASRYSNQPQSQQQASQKSVKRSPSNESSGKNTSEKQQDQQQVPQKQNFFRPSSGKSTSTSNTSKHKSSKLQSSAKKQLPNPPIPQPQQTPPQLSQEQLIEYISKLIKNNRKHFEKNRESEEVIKNLKIFLQKQFEDKESPVSGYQVEDSQEFNNIISELMRVNYHSGANNKGRTAGGKDRANSEKNTSGTYSSSQSSQPQQQKAGQQQQQQQQQQQSKFTPTASNPAYTEQIKILRPTINQSYNKNVYNVMITPMTYGSGQQPGGGPSIPSGYGVPQSSPTAAAGTADSGRVLKTKKRNASEDNVNTQQQQQKKLAAASVLNQPMENNPPHFFSNITAGQNQQVQQTPIQHRKNLPSLDTERQKQSNSKKRGTSADIPMAIQINNSHQPPSSREDSQSSFKQLKLGTPNITQDFINQSGNLDSTTKVDETILQERDRLIKFIKSYIKKNNELPPTTLEYYKFVKLIGKGAFGKVTLGIHKLTGKHVAIKTIEKSYMKDDFSKRKVFQEVYLLKKIKHSNVIRLLEVFESSKHLLMVMEYAGGGDLLKLIKRKGRLQESDAKFIFKQIIYGLAHIHCRSVIHRDIKLDNILLDCEKGVKICDFGVSKIIKKGNIIQEQCGTPAYLAPEIIIDKGYEGFFVDIWSLGVLLFAMLCGTVPFKAQNLEDLHKLILKGEFTFPCELSDEAQALVRGMIRLNPRERLTIPQILAHSWLKETNEDDSEDEEEEKSEGGIGGGGSNPHTKDGRGESQQQKSSDIDLKSIQGNVNYVNVDNLFYDEVYHTKLSYTDYCCITEDFSTENIDEEALKVCENFGFPRSFMIKCLNRGDINHATACYYLLTNAG